MLRFGNRHIEMFKWYSLVTEELKNGMISITIDNEYEYTFNKKKFIKINNNFYDYL